MKITDVRVKVLDSNTNFKGFANVTFDKVFVINGIKIMDGKNGLFLNMPSQKGSDGEYHDVCFPLTKEFRQGLTEEVLAMYEDALEEQVSKTEPGKSRYNKK